MRCSSGSASDRSGSSARALWRADRRLGDRAGGRSSLLRGVLPAGVRRRDGRAGRRGATTATPLAGPLAAMGVVFVLLQVLTPIHLAVGYNLGDRTAAWLYDVLTDACVAPPGHRPPRGPGAGQRPQRGPRVRPRDDRPAAVDLDGLHRRQPGGDGRPAWPRPPCCSATRGGRRSCSAARGWPPTGCCARARSGATATPTRCAAPSATPTTPTASPSTRRRPRSCACSAWPAGRSTASSPGAPRLHELQYEATRLRERSVLVEPGARRRRQRGRVLVAGRRRRRRADRPRPHRDVRPGRRGRVAHRLRRPQLGARRRGRAGRGHRSPQAGHGPGRRAVAGHAARRRACRPRRSASATSPSPTRRRRTAPVLDGFDLTIPAGIVAGHRRPERRRQDHAGQAALPPLRPAVGADRGRRHRPARPRPRRAGASASPRCSRTSSASSCRCATTWRRRAPPTTPIVAALAEAGAHDLAALDTPLAKGYAGGTDLSGGQWQRVALARALCAVRARRRRGAARRAHRPARRARRGRDLRADPGRHPALHDDPHLPPLLDRPPRRPHLRARARPGRGARAPTTS